MEPNDERLDDLAELVRMLAPLTAQVGINQANIDRHADELGDQREWLKDVEGRLVAQMDAVGEECRSFHQEYREDQKAAKTANRAVVVAMIAASATIIAAAIAALAVVLSGGA